MTRESPVRSFALSGVIDLGPNTESAHIEVEKRIRLNRENETRFSIVMVPCFAGRMKETKREDATNWVRGCKKESERLQESELPSDGLRLRETKFVKLVRLFKYSLSENSKEEVLCRKANQGIGIQLRLKKKINLGELLHLAT